MGCITVPYGIKGSITQYLDKDRSEKSDPFLLICNKVYLKLG